MNCCSPPDDDDDDDVGPSRNPNGKTLLFYAPIFGKHLKDDDEKYKENVFEDYGSYFETQYGTKTDLKIQIEIVQVDSIDFEYFVFILKKQKAKNNS